MPLQEMSNLDYHYLQLELQKLVGARLTKVHELRPGLFRLQLHSSAEGRADFVAELGVRAHLTRRIEESPGAPTQFAASLRKRLGNARLSAVEQLSFDRVLSLRFDTAVGALSLVLELLPGGNALLLDLKGVILEAREQKSFEARSLRRGAEYKQPPNARKLPSEADADSLVGLKGRLSQALSKVLRLSPFYIEEACGRAGVEPGSEASSLSAAQGKALAEALRSLQEQKPSPRVYSGPAGPLAFSPFELVKMADASFEGFESFSEALDHYYSLASPVPKAAAAPKKAAVRDLSRVLAAIEAQKRAIAAVEQRSIEERSVGEALFANSHLIEMALEVARASKGMPSQEAEAEILRKTGLRSKVSKGELELELDSGS